MTENTFPSPTPPVLLYDDKPAWRASARNSRRLKGPKFSPDEDIERWLKHNAPLTFDLLAALRYCLYHRCGRAEFKISKKSGDQFTLTGRHDDLRIINDRARHYLLWRLRLLGRKKGWIGALPRTKKPRR
jgi:hypothetical protein